MEEYTLCSSSTEQGEIPVIHVRRPKEELKSFPRNKSQLQYMYLPNTSLFIGPNTIPRSCDYQTTMVTTKLKRKLKHDLPYPFQCLPMNSDRLFFENGFTLVSTVKPARKANLNLVKTKERIVHINEGVGSKDGLKRELSLEHVKDRQCDTYKETCQEFVSGKLLDNLETKKTNIIIKDSIMNSLLRKEAYTHFSVKKKNNELYVVFDEVYFKETKYYDYLSRYGEEVVKCIKSSELRIYSNNETVVVVYSSTLFHDSGRVQRLFGGIDVEKSIDVAVNLDGVRVVKCTGALKDELRILLGIKLAEGEYCFNDWKIYKTDLSGEKVIFNGITFEDFMDNPGPADS